MINSKNHNPDILSCLANLSNDEVFTPPDVANRILDLFPKEFWSNPKISFLDPFSKSGVFLREIAKRLIAGLEKEFPNLDERINHIYQNQVFGIALTELTALITKRTLYCSKSAASKYSQFLTKNINGNIRYNNVKHTWKNGRCIFCSASEKNYNRETDLETYAYEFIHTSRPNQLFPMKFDVILGNPPYQLSDGGYGTSALPIYDKFVDQAIKLNPRYLSMIIPARWFSGGKGLDEFREKMLSDKRLRIIHDFPDATDVFPGVQIKGGICYFLWSRDDRGDCLVVSHAGGSIKSQQIRPLLEKNSETFIRFNEAVPILKKVQSFNELSIEKNVSSRKPFGLETVFKGETLKFKNSIKLYQNGGVGYVKENVLTKNIFMIDKYKVFVPRAGSGSDSFPHSILGKPFIGEPGSASTETYIVVAYFETFQEAKNFLSYLKTKFFRFLVLLNKPTQDAPRRVYKHVPTQDFSQSWNDQKLQKKYNLSNEEISFVNELIREME